MVGLLISTVFITCFMTSLLCDAANTYCYDDTFHAECPMISFIIITHATYGHMGLGRCVADDEMVPCSDDVMQWVDGRCSGRPECSFDVAELHSIPTSQCPMHLHRYLNAAYECIPVDHLPCQACGSPDNKKHLARVTSARGYIASWLYTTQGYIGFYNTHCGSRSCPWFINVNPGQRLNITMYDFSNTTENESYPICLRAGVIQNVVTTEEVTICYRSNERVRNLYITTGESVEIEIAHPDVRSRWGQFLIKYEVTVPGVRILGKSSILTEAGYAQIYREGSDMWYSICHHGWTDSNAHVFCKQLGYDRGTPFSILDTRLYVADPVEAIWNTEITCLRSDQSIANCSTRRVSSNCEPATVTCDQADLHLDNGTLRLVGGPTEYSGMVEVSYMGLWGSICDRMWDETTAGVVCRILGYKEGGMPVRYSSFRLAQEIYLDAFQCTGGHETHIAECMNRPYMVHSCQRSRTAGVVCLQEQYNNLTGQLRLSNGEGPQEGYLQVSFYGVWGTVCSEDWSDSESRVVCRQLGYETGMMSKKMFKYIYGPSWLSYAYCHGNETSLTECIIPRWNFVLCTTEYDVKLECYYKDSVKESPVEYTIWLYSGVSAATIFIIIIVLVVVVCKRKTVNITNIILDDKVVDKTTRNPAYHIDLSFAKQRQEAYHRETSMDENYDYIDDSKNPVYLDLIGEIEDGVDHEMSLGPRTNTPLPTLPGHDVDEYLLPTDTAPRQNTTNDNHYMCPVGGTKGQDIVGQTRDTSTTDSDYVVPNSNKVPTNTYQNAPSPGYDALQDNHSHPYVN